MTYPNGLSLTYTYDAAGRETSMTDQSGYTEKYVYDAAGRLSKVTDGSGNLLVSYTYDAAGRVARQVNANGTSTTISHNADGEVSQIHNLDDVPCKFDQDQDLRLLPESVAHDLSTDTCHIDPDLREIIESWERLPEAIRAGIMAMIHAASKKGWCPTLAERPDA
jgi:YD repeat-containing protein